MGQVTCGEVGLERAVVLPKPLFPLVSKRISELSPTSKYKSPVLSRWYSRDRVYGFLSARCSKDFLVPYIQEHPDVFDRVSKPGLYLSSVSEVDLAIRLHELELLPEEHRRGFVSTVMSYAIEGEDLYGLESLRIQSVFTSTELIEFRTRVRSELVPKLADVRQTWQSNRSSDQRADEHMEPLLSSFSALKEEFAAEPEILSDIDREIERMKEWMSENKPDESKEDRTSRVFGDVDAQDLPPVQLHGIFDDVDE